MIRNTLLILLLCLPLQRLAAQNSDSVKIRMVNMGAVVNSASSDFAPVISADGRTLIFTSRRPATETERKSGNPGLERIYMCSFMTSDSTWSKPVLLPEAVNEPERNNSAIGLSNDGQRLLHYRDDNKGNGQIFESVLKGNNWGSTKLLPEPVNSKAHESSACYSPDGRTIYFVSDRKGGLGGRDIWSSKRISDTEWGPAVNLGPVINTASDEEGVYMHPDGRTLYFSSKGHNSQGGYDVLQSTYYKSKWSQPKRMAAPINTAAHDIFFVLQASGRTGYYSSAMPGGSGEEDLYAIYFEYDTVKVKGPALMLLTGRVYDEKTLASLEAELTLTDNETGQVITTLRSNSATGNFLVSLPGGRDYGINVNAEGYLFESIRVSLPLTTEYSEVKRDIALKRIEVGKRIVLNNIFYDFDKAVLRPESMTELNRLVTLLQDNPTMVIEISSHTDGMGSDTYNQRLSQDRAQSVVDYLSSKGIAAQRLRAKGYGKAQPIADNSTEEGRQLNRRTEFSILNK